MLLILSDVWIKGSQHKLLEFVWLQGLYFIIRVQHSHCGEVFLTEPSAGVLAWPYTVRIFSSFSSFHTALLFLFPSLPGWTSSLESANRFLFTGNTVISKSSLEFEKASKGLVQQMDYCLWEKEANPRNKIKISGIWESRTYFKALAFDNYPDIMIFLLWELPKKLM